LSKETDNQAWVMENEAFHMSSEGAVFARKCAKRLREDAIHGEIVRLFEYGDMQNEIIEIGLKSGELPILSTGNH